eukprot:scaffold319_cov97-Cylindrotheca_fusiformis.AAC.9
MLSQWWRRQSGIAMTTTRRAQCCSTRIHNTSSSSSFWNTTTTTTPPSQRRGRKRGRQNSNHDTKTKEEGLSSSSKSTNNNNKNNDTSSGDVVKTFQSRGWRVLWPNPYYNSPRTWKDSYQQLPSTKEIRQAWKDYKSTWAAGLRGDGIVEDEGDNDNNNNDNNTMSSTDRIRQNASRNLHLVQTDGQEIIMKHFSNKTGIHNSQDLKNFASEMMTLVTNCLKEFMIGYRMGRDEEVEKMLHEYFQDDNNDNDNDNLKTKRKRKPKRFHPPR